MTKNPIVTRDLGQLVYLAALGLYVWARMLEMSLYIVVFTPTFMSVVSQIVLLLVVVSILMQRLSWTSGLVSAGILLLGYVSFVNSTEVFILVLAMLIVGAKNVRFRDIGMVVLGVVIVTGAFILISTVRGNLENHVWEDHWRTRNGLGFRYPLFPSNFYFYATLLVVWLTRGRLRVWWAVLLGAGAVGVYFLTFSRAALILTLVALALTLIPRSMWASQKSGNRVVATLAALFYPLIATVAIALAFTGTARQPLLEKLDSFLGSRLTYAARSLELHGASLFGTPTYFRGNGLGPDGTRGQGEYTFIDNSFANMFVRFGAIPTLAILAGMGVLMWLLVRQGRWVSTAILLLVGVHSSIDSWFLYVELNAFILLLGTELLRSLEAPQRSPEHVERS